MMVNVKKEINGQFVQLCKKLTNKYKPRFSFSYTETIGTSNSNDRYATIYIHNKEHKFNLFHERFAFKNNSYGLNDVHYKTMSDVEDKIEEDVFKILNSKMN
jgi:hypothetical protein